MAASRTQIKPKRMERLKIRITQKQKERLEYAAALQDTSVPEFVVQAVSVAATRLIERDQVITSVMEEQAAFMKALSRPPQTNPRLEAAFRRHGKRTKY